MISKRVRYISNQGTPLRNIVNISLQLDGFLFYCLTDSNSNVTEKKHTFRIHIVLFVPAVYRLVLK